MPFQHYVVFQCTSVWLCDCDAERLWRDQVTNILSVEVPYLPTQAGVSEKVNIEAPVREPIQVRLLPQDHLSC